MHSCAPPRDRGTPIRALVLRALVLRAPVIRQLVAGMLLAALMAAGVVPQAAPASAGGGDLAGDRIAADLPDARLSGPDRVQTSAAGVQAWADGLRQADRVVVVDQARPVAALLASPLASALGTVVLLSHPSPQEVTLRAAEAVGARTIVVHAEGPLADGWRAHGFEVEPLTDPEAAGADAAGEPARDPADSAGDVALSAAVAGRVLSRTGGDTLLLGGTDGLADLMGAATLAARTRTPIALTGPDALDEDIAALISARADTTSPLRTVTVVGGVEVVSPRVEEDLRGLGLLVDRVAGADRAATSVALADEIADQHHVGAGPLRPHLVAPDGMVDAAALAGLVAARRGIVLVASPAARAWLAGRCGTLPPVVALGGTARLPQDLVDTHLTAQRRCDGPDAPVVVRVAAVARDVPDDQAVLTEAVQGPRGWSTHRVRTPVVPSGHQIGLVIADAACAAAPGTSRQAAICAHGRDLVIDAETWRFADPARRQRLVDLAIGWWLGLPRPDGCAGTPMDPLDCPDVAITEADREGLADRHIPGARLAFGGDVHAERHLADRFRGQDNPLAPVSPLLQAADVAVVNLETPLSTRGTPASKTYTFRGPPETAGALVDVGIDLVTLANNHALDYGVAALDDTLVHARDAGLRVVGAGPDAGAAYAAEVIDTPAGSVAFVGLTRVLHTLAWEASDGRAGLASAYDEGAATAAVRAAASQADHVVVLIHWGTERADCPDAHQRRLAPLLAEAGADLVVGHHPHVLQGVQALGGTLVAYSLGNFVWYHNRAPSRFTGILELELPVLDGTGWRFVPAEIDGRGSPLPATGVLAQQIEGRLSSRSPGGALGCAFPAPASD